LNFLSVIVLEARYPALPSRVTILRTDSGTTFDSSVESIPQLTDGSVNHPSDFKIRDRLTCWMFRTLRTSRADTMPLSYTNDLDGRRFFLGDPTTPRYWTPEQLHQPGIILGPLLIPVFVVLFGTLPAKWHRGVGIRRVRFQNTLEAGPILGTVASPGVLQLDSDGCTTAFTARS